jgi:hypothetical protein
MPLGGGRPVSALGQKQTCAAHKAMTALCQERTCDRAVLVIS